MVSIGLKFWFAVFLFSNDESMEKGFIKYDGRCVIYESKLYLKSKNVKMKRKNKYSWLARK